MKKLTITLIALMSTLSIIAQETKTYKGPYGEGVAEYTYTENDKMQRLLSGKFQYTDTLEVAGRGECQVMMTGSFRDDKKAGPWVASIKASDNSSNETVTGPFLNGQKSGFWTHRVTIGDKDIKTSTATFNRNKFKGAFAYNYEPVEPVATYQKLKIEGGFDNEGFFDGEWKIVYTDMNGVEIEDVLRYQHGVLAFRVQRETASGKEIERFDKESFVTAFFKNMQSLDSSSVVDEKKFGLRKKMNKHEVIVPIMKAWNDLEGVKLGNAYNASIPTMIVTKGEFAEPMYLQNEKEIIDWKDTPKGRAEWEEEQRILKEYKENIGKADAALSEKNYEEALKLYRYSSTLKKDETYPMEQIPKVEELILVRNKRNRLLGSVKEKAEMLEKEQDKIEADENFEKKQKHLHEAYHIGYDYQYRGLRSDHSRVRSNIENGLGEECDVADLEAYESDLKKILDYQAKVGSLIGTDTKDLEKEVKKMEDPMEIISRLTK